MPKTFHLAIIPDGNRRWAKSKGMKGYRDLYQRGIDGLLEITESAFDHDVTHLSLWGSSHANLVDRSSDFSINFDRVLRENIHRFAEHPVIEKYEVRIRVIGEWQESLSQATIEAFEKVMDKTARYSSRELTLLIDYSGARERAAAVSSILSGAHTSSPADQLLRVSSWTGHLPDLDLVIRTGSWQDPHNSAGFMSLLADECQLAFPEVYWPDFTDAHLHAIIEDFRSRERRRGK